MRKIQIDILREKNWDQIGGIEKFIIKTAQKLIEKTDLGVFLKQNPENSLQINILLTASAKIKKINREFRGRDKSTNVLSFPFLSREEIAKNGFFGAIQGFNHQILGDIVISLDDLRGDILQSDKNFYDHLTHLLLHSILHLIGFDHEVEAEAEEMEGLEIEILQSLGIANPYF